jgi:hypothetical protein
LRIEFLELTGQAVSSNLIELDDFSRGSFAVYRAINDSNKAFYCYMPEEAEQKKERKEPRCDYLLVCREDNTVRFIELKGQDLPRNEKCCKSHWQHAFHQLRDTYNSCAAYIEEKDDVKMILCTSIPEAHAKRIASRYRQYKYYKKICESFGIIPKILYSDNVDVV